jgi:hypothetical protein
LPPEEPAELAEVEEPAEPDELPPAALLPEESDDEDEDEDEEGESLVALSEEAPLDPLVALSLPAPTVLPLFRLSVR